MFFSHQNEPHTATLSFSADLKYFTEIVKKLLVVTKVFSQQNEPHTAKLWVSAILKHFYGN